MSKRYVIVNIRKRCIDVSNFSAHENKSPPLKTLNYKDYDYTDIMKLFPVVASGTLSFTEKHRPFEHVLEVPGATSCISSSLIECREI